MGVLTIMFMASSFGSEEVKLSEDQMIPILLIIQLVGIFGAWSFARLSGRIGNFRAFIISVFIWIVVSIFAYFITGLTEFIIAAFFIGIVMGGTQSLARSTYSKMLPETTDHTSFFSFFDVLEKLAAVGGTFCFGLIDHLTGSLRNAVIAIALFFIIGFIFMLMLVRSELIRPGNHKISVTPEGT
jgi:UMF1 family MFS transporter